MDDVRPGLMPHAREMAVRVGDSREYRARSTANFFDGEIRHELLYLHFGVHAGAVIGCEDDGNGLSCLASVNKGRASVLMHRNISSY